MFLCEAKQLVRRTPGVCLEFRNTLLRFSEDLGRGESHQSEFVAVDAEVKAYDGEAKARHARAR